MFYNLIELKESVSKCLSFLETQIISRSAYLDILDTLTGDQRISFAMSIILGIEEEDLKQIIENMDSEIRNFWDTYLKAKIMGLEPMRAIKEQFQNLNAVIGASKDPAELADELQVDISVYVGLKKGINNCFEKAYNQIINKLPRNKKKKYQCMNFDKLENSDLSIYTQLRELFPFKSPWVERRDSYVIYDIINQQLFFNITKMRSWHAKAQQRLDLLGPDARITGWLNKHQIEIGLIGIPFTNNHQKVIYSLQLDVDKRLNEIEFAKRQAKEAQLTEIKNREQQGTIFKNEQHERAALEGGLLKSLHLFCLKVSHQKEMHNTQRESFEELEIETRESINRNYMDGLASIQLVCSHEKIPLPTAEKSSKSLVVSYDLEDQEATARAQIASWRDGELNKLHLSSVNTIPAKFFQRTESMFKVNKLPSGSQDTLSHIYSYGSKIETAIPEISFEEIEQLLLCLGGSKHKGKTTGSHRKFKLADFNFNLNHFSSTAQHSVTVVKPHEGNVHVKSFTLKVLFNVLNEIGIFKMGHLLAPRAFPSLEVERMHPSMSHTRHMG